MMKSCLMLLCLGLAACTHSMPLPPNTQVAETTEITAPPTQPETEKTEQALPQYDAIGAVVTLLNLPTPSENHQDNPQLNNHPHPYKTITKKRPTPRPKPTPPLKPVALKIPAKSSPKPTPAMTDSSRDKSPMAPRDKLNDAPELPTLSEMAHINHNDVYAKATTLFQQKKYQQVIHLLRQADTGGDGSQSARKQMYLLLLSHQKLNNCQSVINLGQRLAGQFSGSSESAEAQFMVGQCQWHIQQRDIAKETWRQLIASQPHSAAAQRAKISLRQK